MLSVKILYIHGYCECIVDAQATWKLVWGIARTQNLKIYLLFWPHIQHKFKKYFMKTLFLQGLQANKTCLKSISRKKHLEYFSWNMSTQVHKILLDLL